MPDLGHFRGAAAADPKPLSPASLGSWEAQASPTRDSSCGALTNMARLKSIIMTLMKVKHPILAPGERGERLSAGCPHPGTAPALLRARLSPTPAEPSHRAPLPGAPNPTEPNPVQPT